ncbi:hypothetical protein BTVI_147194 [Pitangus sulphuratus]|nr:hypothetical protein BTVI_147194 [Pitangus sulphuratus]
MKFNKSRSKFKVLHLGQGNPRQDHRLSEVVPESNLGEDDFMWMKSWTRANSVCPGLHQKRSGQQAKEGGSSLCSALVRPHLGCCIQHRTDMDLLKWVQRRAMKMVRGLEHLSYGDS